MHRHTHAGTYMYAINYLVLSIIPAVVFLYTVRQDGGVNLNANIGSLMACNKGQELTPENKGGKGV